MSSRLRLETLRRILTHPEVWQAAFQVVLSIASLFPGRKRDDSSL